MWFLLEKDSVMNTYLEITGEELWIINVLYLLSVCEDEMRFEQPWTSLMNITNQNKTALY